MSALGEVSVKMSLTDIYPEDTYDMCVQKYQRRQNTSNKYLNVVINCCVTVIVIIIIKNNNNKKNSRTKQFYTGDSFNVIRILEIQRKLHITICNCVLNNV